jgi:putative spermidine/putrescine transport system ATP-binding protein
MSRDVTPERRGGASIEIQGLVKRYGGFSAVDGLDLRIEAGEFLTFLGPSGSGKTTILNILSGFLSPDDGHILVDGQPIQDVPPHRRNFGVVFQNYALFPHMTVEDNIAFPLRMRGTSRAHASERIAATLALVGLSEHAAKLPGQLSGGQQQRVALARALVYEPRVVLMDEPLSALDRRLREALQLELKELHRKVGATIVYVTHDQGEALTMSDRVAVLNKGRLLACGRPLELYENPPNLFVATFLGESNRFRGTVRRVDVGSVVVDLEFGWSLTATSAERLAPGQAVIVTIRPERIQLEPGSGGGRPGIVDRVLFLGEIIRLQVRLDEGGSLQLRVQNERGWAPPSEGSRVKLTWSALDARALQGE